jgi:transcriptional regulator GlxA family with amidase domain
MEAWIEEPRDRTMVASAAGISLRQLERLFIAHVGLSMTDIYLRIRLDQAAQLIGSTGMSITAVALACGFRSAAHFSRSFKARHGITPSAARKRRPARDASTGKGNG